MNLVGWPGCALNHISTLSSSHPLPVSVLGVTAACWCKWSFSELANYKSTFCTGVEAVVSTTLVFEACLTCKLSLAPTHQLVSSCAHIFHCNIYILFCRQTRRIEILLGSKLSAMYQLCTQVTLLTISRYWLVPCLCCCLWRLWCWGRAIAVWHILLCLATACEFGGLTRLRSSHHERIESQTFAAALKLRSFCLPP